MEIKQPILLPLTQLFESYTKEKLVTSNGLTKAGSNRHYFRLSGANTVLIGVYGQVIDENEAFITLSNHFSALGLPVPKVLAVSDDRYCYLLNDLGDLSLFNAIANGRNTGQFADNEKALLHAAIAQLPRFQCEGEIGLDFSLCYPRAEFDERLIMWDLNYFKYSFLKPSGVSFNEDKLEDDFLALAKLLTNYTSEETGFMYRDFQSRNVMIHDNSPWFIDFQGGMRGPVYYDVASFLYQAKAAFPQPLRDELLDTYLNTLSTIRSVNKEHFVQHLKHYVYFRILQTLGAYGYRGFFERKPHFIESVPFALTELNKHLASIPFPYLREVLTQVITANPAPVVVTRANDNRLRVRVYSFSYRKGIPEDYSGNGGGFVFDCRAVHNPGRFEEYKTLTGLNKEVQDFFRQKGDMEDFLSRVYKVVDFAVQRYLDRGYTNLMLSFGCTGGQHRSVFSAQTVADYLVEKYNVVVDLTHRELNINEIKDKK